MDLDPTLRGGLEMGLKICPMKTSTDTSKAFDSVENGRLLDKLGWYGIDHRWFAAWLKERIQTVSGATGALDVTHVIVQGSILGPVLYIVFTSDLPQHVQNCKLVSYADDCQFFDADTLRSMRLNIE